MLHAHRIATADPYVHELSPAQALRLERAGARASRSPTDSGRTRGSCASASAATRRRSAALRPQERLAELLGAREEPLLCEELALRARLDLDQGRLAHAAMELERVQRRAARAAGEDRQDWRGGSPSWSSCAPA